MENLVKAKIEYPIGSKFKCVNGNINPNTGSDIWTVVAYNTQGKGRIYNEPNGWICLDGKWAEKVIDDLFDLILIL